MSKFPPADTDAELNSDHIAFLKNLVSEGPLNQTKTGFVLLVGGSAYVIQCLLILGQLRGLIPADYFLYITTIPTLILLAAMGRVMWSNRHTKTNGVGQRALNAVWGSAGLTNLVILLVFGWISYSQQSFIYWMLYVVVACAVQGAVWYIAATIRRKLWLGAVSAVWFASAIGMALAIDTPEIYILIGAAALFGGMALPGYAMWRGAPPNTTFKGASR